MGDLFRELIQDPERDRRNSFSVEKCKIATTATSIDDDVEVTFPLGDAPMQREPIDFWRPGINDDGSVRYPTRGEVGMVIELDTGELWLIF